MTKSAGDYRQSAGFDPQACVAFLRRQHPAKTAQAVEARSRVPARTVERWLSGDTAPSVAAFARLTMAYGPAFVAACIPGLAWVERAAAVATHDGLADEIAALDRRRMDLARALGLDRGAGS